MNLQEGLDGINKSNIKYRTQEKYERDSKSSVGGAIFIEKSSASGSRSGYRNKSRKAASRYEIKTDEEEEEIYDFKEDLNETMQI